MGACLIGIGSFITFSLFLQHLLKISDGYDRMLSVAKKEKISERRLL